MYVNRNKIFTDRNSNACLIKMNASITKTGMSRPSCRHRGCVKVACVPNQNPTKGDVCWIGGWDNSYHTMTHFGVNLLSENYCNAKRASDNPRPLKREFCTGIPDRDHSGKLDTGVACKSDVGDALICDINGKATLIGIVGHPPHANCRKDGHPILLDRVELMKSWISSKLTTTVSDRAPTVDVVPTAATTTSRTPPKIVGASTGGLSRVISYKWKAPSDGKLLTILDNFSTDFRITFEMKLTMMARIGSTAIEANILQLIPKRAEDKFTAKQSNRETCVKAGRIPGLTSQIYDITVVANAKNASFYIS